MGLPQLGCSKMHTMLLRLSRIAPSAAFILLLCFISVEAGSDDALAFARARPQAAVLGIAAAASFVVSTLIDPSLPAQAQYTPAFDALGLTFSEAQADTYCAAVRTLQAALEFNPEYVRPVKAQKSKGSHASCAGHRSWMKDSRFVKCQDNPFSHLADAKTRQHPRARDRCQRIHLPIFVALFISPYLLVFNSCAVFGSINYLSFAEW